MYLWTSFCSLLLCARCFAAVLQLYHISVFFALVVGPLFALIASAFSTLVVKVGEESMCQPKQAQGGFNEMKCLAEGQI